MLKQITLSSFLALPLEERKSLVVVRSFLRKNRNGNKKTVLICDSISDTLLFKASLRDAKAKKAPRKLGKPCKHHTTKAIASLGSKPKIVTGNMFPNTKNVIHFQTKEAKDSARYTYDAFAVFAEKAMKGN